jgi:hypothetical protein
MRFHYTAIGIATTQITENTGKDVDNQKFSLITGGMQNGTTTLEDI